MRTSSTDSDNSSTSFGITLFNYYVLLDRSVLKLVLISELERLWVKLMNKGLQKICIFLFAIAALAASAGSDIININTTLSQWNIITYQNLTSINDLQGRAFIGGNITNSNSFTAATSDTSKTDVSLAVMGSINSGNPINVNGGSVDVGGSTNSRIFNMNSQGSVTTKSSWPAGNSPLSQITQDSTYWSTLSGNGTTNVANNVFNFVAPANTALAVFNITDSTSLELANTNFNLMTNSSTKTILINVNSSDGTVNLSSSSHFINDFLQSTWEGQVLWNFYNASAINLGDIFTGYLVAPNANITGNNDIVGGVVAKNLSIGEVHLPNSANMSSWNGNLPNSIPEPCSVSLIAFGLLLIGRRRHLAA
jgi:choice-of-anchor A domain-containing protein